ncbi:MAG TPA: hypothetical protein VF642_12350 [Propionibacteriaceae bacterium]|jgi:hypothetical protein
MPALPTLELTVISGDSTRVEVEEALTEINARAKRVQTRDGLSRLNPEHARLHAFLDYLLRLWEAAT